ncbi:MAG: hypothetical protein EXS36_18630 [Pedosphaera sp.]|nr:hypothetical protein [Pedosphaera sp.]
MPAALAFPPSAPPTTESALTRCPPARGGSPRTRSLTSPALWAPEVRRGRSWAACSRGRTRCPLASSASPTALYRNLTNTLVRFGTNGVRAMLWHQGESDSLVSTTAANYALRLSNIVVRSRSAAGWSVPWGIAEASFHPAATRAQEEPVAAGQRRFTYATPDCFRGPRTDDFNLENKINTADGVHFNAVGLLEHAQQWANALFGVENLTLKNGNFEANRALNDGVTATSSRIIGWNRLNSAGTAIATGANGYFNPNNGTYPDGDDTLNGGVLPNLNGRHVGTLAANVASNAFLQTLSAHLRPSMIKPSGAVIFSGFFPECSRQESIDGKWHLQDSCLFGRNRSKVDRPLFLSSDPYSSG